MASQKRKHKRDSVERRERLAGAPPRPPKDGDRRRRGFGSLAKEVLAFKRRVRDWTIDDGPPIDGSA
jgi:hypothetical protein